MKQIIKQDIKTLLHQLLKKILVNQTKFNRFH